MKGALGILGGMGPLATVDFMQKVIEATSAERDQDHIPILVHAVPQVPDRTESILAGNDEPLEWMRRGADILRDGGAECIAIPCPVRSVIQEIPTPCIAEAACPCVPAVMEPLR